MSLSYKVAGPQTEFQEDINKSKVQTNTDILRKVSLSLFQKFCKKNIKRSEKSNYSLLDDYAGLDMVAWPLNI